MLNLPLAQGKSLDNEVIIPRGFKTFSRPRDFQIAWFKNRTKSAGNVMPIKQSL